MKRSAICEDLGHKCLWDLSARNILNAKSIDKY